MSWPLSHEFNEAVQNPHVVFSDPDLKGGETVVGATGLPLPRSGNFADVYQVRGADGREWAVKCFTRPVVGLAERYAKLSDALAKAELPFAVGFAYLAEGIRVGGVWRPVVKMEWVEGLLLNQVLRENAGKPKVLSALGQMWSKLCKRLREAGIAHADIQHGNVLLVPGSRPGAYGLKLIDYDGMWVPALANTPSGESGHPSYQHPARAATRTYSPDVDRFPHLVVATALRGLSVGGSALWERYDNGDNVLFTEADYKKPSDSKLMKELWHTGDPTVQALVGRLAIASGKPVPQTPWLDVLAPEGDPGALDDTTRRAAAEALGISLPVPVALPPLPPEPSLELPPEPSYVVEPEPEPEPLPPEPEFVPPAPAPLQPVFVFDDGVDVEPIEDRRPAKRKSTPKKRKDEEAGASNTRVLLFAGGGLLLLIGGVVAGVMIAGGGKQKPAETVQQKEDEPKDTGTKGQGGGAKPKDQGPVAPPVTPPVAPPVVPPVSPPVPGAPDRFDPRQAWLFPLPDMAFLDAPLAGRDSRTALIQLGNRGEMLILDLETGKPLQSPPEHFDMSGAALDGGRFSAARLVGRPGVPQPQISVWDPREAKYVQHLSARDLMVPSMVYVSPTGKYLAATTNGRAGGDTFKLKSTDPEKVILDVPWARGSAFFTDDESRVLLADATGECRWYKLPSGEPDREWKIEKKGPDLTPMYRIMSASGDGSVLAFYGTVGELQRAVHVLDGATGKVLFSTHPLGALFQPPTLSRDGRFMLFHDVRPGQSDRAVVFDVVTHAAVCNFGPPEGFFTFRPVLTPDGRGAVAVLGGEKGRRAVARYDFGRPGAVAVVKPPEAVPPMPAAPGEPPTLKARWTAVTEDFMHRTHQTAAGKFVLGGSAGNRGGAAFEAATGAPRAEFAALVKGGAHAFFPLTNGRVGKWQLGARTISLWDEQTGKDLGKIDLPNVPRADGGFPLACLSPSARFVATGWTQNAPKFEKNVPLRVFDLDTNKEVLSLDWPGGSVHFTADSARVLIAEYTGRCKWYKLPSGDPDGDGWNFGAPAHWRHDITSASADGSVLAYIGVLDGRLTAASVDGKTGAVLQRFNIANTTAAPVVSSDGRRIAVPATEQMGLFRVDVADARTGAVRGRVSTGSRLVSFTLSRDGAVLALATSGPNAVQLFDVPGDGAIAVKPPDPAPVPQLPDPLILGHPTDPLFRDLAPEGGHLIGLEIGLGKFGASDVIHGLRPIYRTGAKETKGEQRGGPNLRVTTVKAKVGYAIGSVTVKAGLGLDGLSVTFMKIVDGKLDPTDAYESDWVGGKGGNVPVKLGGDGTPIVGIVGRTNRNGTDGLGVLLKGQEAFDPAREPTVIAGGNHPLFKDLAPEGGLLIGLELGLGTFIKDDVIQAGRPIYRVGNKETKGVQRGTNLTRVVTLKAKDGYAVGAVTCKSGLNFDGCSLTFMRVKPDGTLDPRDSYESEWAGYNGNKVPVKLGGDGKPVVGVAGRATDKQLHGLGPLFKGQESFEPGGAVAVKPPDPEPGPPPKAGELTLRWSVPVKPGPRGGAHFDRDGRTVALVYGGIPWSIDAFNVQDGKLVRDLPNLKGNSGYLTPLEKGKFAYWADHAREIVVWDTAAGKSTSCPFPQAGGRQPYLSVSPDGRYALVGTASSPGRGEVPETPFLVIDVTNKKELFSKTWRSGSALFTADSSRVLTVDDAGSFRWFKLPRGEADGNWSFDLKSDGFNARNVSVSGNGSLVLYEGPVPGKDLTYHLLNGKTGEIIHSLPAKRYAYSGRVSDDGQFVALVRNDGFGSGHSVEVVNRRGEAVASVRVPGAGKPGAVYISLAWKGRSVVVAARDGEKLSVYDLGVPSPK